MRARAPAAITAHAALLALVLLAGCTDEKAAAPAPGAGAALKTQTLQPETVPQWVLLDGVLEAVNQSTVAAQTNARVDEILYDVGDFVEKGAVIIRFRGTEQGARLGSAQAGLQEASARLAEAELQHDRVKKIYEEGVIARAQYDQAIADLKSARARVEAARAGVQEAREGADYTVVRAPYAGIVVKRHIEVGETATVGRPLMTGLSLEHLRAIVEVPQQQIGPLRQHRKARVILQDGESVEAAEVRITPSADPATHTYHVHVVLPEGRHGNGYPGMLVKVAFVGGTAEQLLLPAGAVVQRGEVTGAYVVDGGDRVALRYLRTGTPTPDGWIPVLSGLVAGEKVALDPVAAGAALRRQAGGA